MEINTHHVYLSLGSNLGDRHVNLQTAIDAIEQTCGKVIALSSLYESASWGYESNNKYLNNCIEMETTLSPEQLLASIKQIEEQQGRNFTQNYTDRPIDIDILFYDREIIEQDKLTIPHPLLAKRTFVLQPMSELNAEFIHPRCFLTIQQLLSNLHEPKSKQ